MSKKLRSLTRAIRSVLSERAVKERNRHAVHGKKDLFVSLLHGADGYFAVRFQYIRARRKAERADRCEDNAVGARLDNRPARRHGVSGRPGRRGGDHSVAGKRRNFSSVAECFKLHNAHRGTDDRFVESASLIDQLALTEELEIEHHARLYRVMAVGHFQYAVRLCLLQFGEKALVAEIDAEVMTVKEKRKDANAEVKTYTTICAAAEKQLKPGDVKTYAEKIDIADLMEEQNENARLIEKAKTVRTALQTRTEQLEAIPGRIKAAEETKNTEIDAAIKYEAEAQAEYDRIVAEAKKALEAAKKKSKADAKAAADKYDETLAQIQTDKADYETRKNNAAAWLAKYEENNPENLDTAERLKQAEEHNKINALVVDYLTKKKQKDAAEKVAQTHEKKLSDLLKERETLIAKSELPIAGLTFTDDGLELNGVPFVAGKVSDSQIMEVAAKLIIASNPTVKVFRIARGESLGAKRLQSLIELARKEGYQGFIEEVKRGQDDLIIEEYSETE